MRITLFVSALGLGLGAWAASPVDAYDVIWDRPSTNHHGSMPLGNGDVALNAWFTPAGELHFYLGKSDAWDDHARLVKVGKVRVRFEPNPVTPGAAYRQELRLGEGCLEVTTRTARGSGDAAPDFRLRLWVDAHHPVVEVEAESTEPRTATAVLELWRTNRHELASLEVSDVLHDPARPDRKHAPTWVEPDTVLPARPGRVGWYHHNLKSVGPQLMAEVQGLTGFAQPDPLLHRTFGAVVTAPGGEAVDHRTLRSPRGLRHRFRVVVLTRHPAAPEQWQAAMDETLRRVEGLDVAERWAAHAAWWRAFWDRSWIRATRAPGAAITPTASPPGREEAAYVSQMYHLQRFLTACAGRGAYPIKFNGSLFTVPPGPTEADPDYRRWGPGYWWQNTRLPYLSLNTSGDFDLQEPLFRMYVDRLLPLCRYRTRHYLGHDGAFYPECMMFWGAIFSETYGWTPFAQRADKLQESGWHKWEWVGGLELAWMALDYYDHTRDEEFLRARVRPLLREVLTFFEQHYPTNAAGQLVLYPSQALETWWRCTNAAPELAGLHALTARVAPRAEQLLPEADRDLARRLRAKLPPLPLRAINGRTALAPAESFADKRNIENPELYAVFPFRLFAFNRPHVEWALAALEHREDRGHFGWRQDDIFMAYLGLAEETRRAIVSRALQPDPNERFPAFWGPNYDWTPDQDHGGVLMKTLQAMVLQTDGDQIFLLPAWPRDWDVEFKLHAPQQTVVEGVYRGGRLESWRVTPESRRRDVMVVSH